MKTYKVRIQEIGKAKYLEVIVQARTQVDAKRIAEAQYGAYKVLSVSEQR